MFTSLLYAQDAAGEATQHTAHGGSIMGFLPIIIIVLTTLIILYIKRRNSLIESGKLIISEAQEANKRILGIILTSLGGVAAIIFGLILSEASNKLYFTAAQEERAIITYAIITGVGVITFIIGFIMILNSRLVSKTSKAEKAISTNSSLTELDKLEKLSELKDKGILTEEEFNSKKKKILDD